MLSVFKFGGASLRDTERIQNVANILAQYRDRSRVVVVSAMGKTTNALEEVVQAYHTGDGRAAGLLEAIKQDHYRQIAELFGPEAGEAVAGEVNDLFVEVEWILEDAPEDNYDYTYDQIVSIGELVSSRIVAAYLNHRGLPTHWLDARSVVLTDDLYRESWVQWSETEARAQRHARPLLDRGGFVLTQGFIGSTTENNTTTLGREGSDYTAAIFSYCLDAADMTIWKDVPGVLTGDPRVFDNVTKLDELSYREAIEMTYYGAKVIHPKTIKPLQNKSIPLYVKSFLEPSGAGTYIADDANEHYPPMVAIEREQALINISTRDFSFVAEHHMKDLFQHIADHRLQINLMRNTAISFVICVNDTDDRIDRFAAAIDADFKVRWETGLELYTIRHAQPQILATLREGRIVQLEDQMGKTVQMVVKPVSMMSFK